MINLLLTSPRTGSTWYSGIIRRIDTTIDKDLGEYFHPSFRHEHADRLNYISDNTKTFLLKLFYSHTVESPIENLLEKCISIATTKTILLRKNIDQHIQSYYVALQYEAFKKNVNWNFNQPVKNILELSESNGNQTNDSFSSTFQQNFKEPFRVSYDNKLFSDIKKQIENEILEISKIYKAGLGFDLIFLEDIQDNHISLARPGKLYRPVIWDIEPLKTHLKIEDLF